MISRLRLVLTEIGTEGWIFGLTALAAVIFGLLDFTPVINLTSDPALRMILVALGLVMLSILAQTGRRSIEMKELRDSLGASSVELIGTGDEFRLHAKRQMTKAKKFVLDTTLNAERAPTLTHPADNPAHYYHTIWQRVHNREITYRRVEVIFNKERLEYVVSRLLVHEGTDFYIRYYDPPPKAIPILNIMSIDNEEYYLGGFYSGDAPLDAADLAFIRNAQMGKLFERYWDNLWFTAKPLNEGRRINWDELRAISERVKMSNEEFDAMVAKWKSEIQRRNRRKK